MVFGDVNPTGRLTQTWYRSVADLPDSLDYDIIKARRTYQYFDGDPLYAFGYGLSYSTFRYGAVRVDGGRVSVPVTNMSDRARRRGRPTCVRACAPGAGRDENRAAVDRRPVPLGRDARPGVVESGTYDVFVGSSSSDTRQRVSVRPDTAR